MRPIIGISCGIAPVIKNPNTVHLPSEFHQLSETYVRAIEHAGGVPVILPVFGDPALAAEAVERLDAVLLSGGGDLDPANFGQRVSSRCGSILPRRDASDLSIAKYAIEKTNKPVLGICRGVQVINVAMGGSLYQDLLESGMLDHQLTMYPRSLPSHKAQVLPGTRLAALLGEGSTDVNSYHHQAVWELAPGFIVSARSIPDEVIEAIELPGERFVVGLQWHPEGLTNSEAQQGIFRRFVQAAGR